MADTDGSKTGSKLVKVHAAFVVFWALVAVLSFVFGWARQVWFVTILSELALILASAGAWQAARVERKQDGDG